MLTYDPVASLQYYPASMARFGQNPYSEPLYRIVFAPSRRYLVVGEWPDGANCAQWVIKHKNLGNIWIMERWRSAEDYTKCSREHWNACMLMLGPWPERGEYELCHAFELSGPEDANLDKLVALIEHGRTIRFYDTLNWHREDAAKEKKATQQLAEDMIRNRLPAFGGRALSYGTHGRSFKTARQLKTAQEVGLPIIPGAPRDRGVLSRHSMNAVPQPAA